jgi:hypothetical protein
METTGRSEAKLDHMPAATAPPLQVTLRKPRLWPARILVGRGCTCRRGRGGRHRPQSKLPFCNCRGRATSGSVDRHSSTSVSRRPLLPEAGARWDT